MADSEFEALKRRVLELEQATKSQTMTNRQEKDWSPVGGPIRVVDRHGNTLPFQQTIQFLNADVAQVNDQATGIQRTVVTPSGGGGGMAGEFSDDGTTADAERIKFVGEDDPSKNHLVLDTLTSGTTRIAALVLADDASVIPSGSLPAAGAVFTEDDSGTTNASAGLSTTVDHTVPTSLGQTSLSASTDDLTDAASVTAGVITGNGATFDVAASSASAGRAAAIAGRATGSGSASVAVSAHDTSATPLEAAVSLEAVGASGTGGLVATSAAVTTSHSASGAADDVLVDDLGASTYVRCQDPTSGVSTPRKVFVGLPGVATFPAGTVLPSVQPASLTDIPATASDPWVVGTGLQGPGAATSMAASAQYDGSLFQVTLFNVAGAAPTLTGDVTVNVLSLAEAP